MPAGTILLTTRATIGLRAILKVPAATNQGFQSLVVNTENDNQFIYYLLGLHQSELIKNASGSTFLELSPKKLGEISLCLPSSHAEQKTLATALSDVDALLYSLDALIVKKRDIKTAAMQELLTGKKRLPGFSGEWKSTKISELGSFKSGSGFPEKYQGTTNDKNTIPFFKVSDLNNNKKFLIISNNYITREIAKEIHASLIPQNSIIFAKIGAAIFLERKRILFQDSYIDNNMCAFLCDKNINHLFIYYKFLEFKLGELVSTTALPALSSTDLNNIVFVIPSDLEEQAAIAAVLSDMDAEIAALEARRAKVQALKQGMMQELLTGRTRLLPEGE